MAGEAFHKRVNGAYQALIASEPDRFLVINAAGHKQDTADLVFRSVMKRLKRDGVA